MKTEMSKDFEIVVAHYSEDLEWLRPYAKHAIVYHKGKEDKPRFECKKWIKIDNVGREAHTYLYHIVNNYDNLPEYTFFFQGGIEDHKQSGDVYNSMEKYFSETKKYNFSCASLLYLIKKSPQIKHGGKWLEMLKNGSLKKAKYPFNEFYEKLLGEHQKLFTPFFYAANFGVTRELIQKRGKDFRNNAISLIPNHSNPEEAHYYERLWFRTFNPKGGFSLHYITKFIKTLFVAGFYKLFVK